jgi:hypothetical protein
MLFHTFVLKNIVQSQTCICHIIFFFFLQYYMITILYFHNFVYSQFCSSSSLFSLSKNVYFLFDIEHISNFFCLFVFSHFYLPFL